MVEMYNNIRNLINRPSVNIEGLRKLLSKVQGEEEQNLHPITKDITERTIYYVIEVNYDDEEETCNDKMDMLATNLDKITNVIRSGSILNKEEEIKQVWFKQGELRTRTSIRQLGGHHTANNRGHHQPLVPHNKGKPSPSLNIIR